ncbi:MAG: ABC transporter ATP-binding protein [Chloroflexi bacterium]|nr:ABC transporter ATP-binding protein [Chloroflexota bacterium]
MNDNLVINTQGLTKTFKGVNALTSLDLKVSKHSIFGFLGPNGAGKTTTIKLLLGLSRPTAGGGTVFGMDLVHDSPDIRKRVGYLAQDPRYYENMTARETLRYTARFFYTGPKNGIEDRIDNTLELVDLTSKADRPIKGFSGGERQRLGIAQAQINFPDLLILDEPAASLDPMGRHDVLEVMERLRKHTTIFYSTHILSDVQRVSDTVAILNRGKLVAQASIGELLNGAGLVYSLAFRGEPNGTQERLSGLPWVSGIQAYPEASGQMRWDVAVSDEAAAEQQLLRTVMDDSGIVVTAFGRKKHDLEEVFMSIVEGNHVR